MRGCQVWRTMALSETELLRELCAAVAMKLSTLGTEGEISLPGRPPLLFPLLRGKPDGKCLPRISEQELRQLAISCVPDGWAFSVETPTNKTYVQSGERGGTSARIDLTLFRPSPAAWARRAHIECKANNPGQAEFRKDIEKLVREGLPGGWLHLLDNVGPRTLPSAFEKLRSSLHDVLDALRGDGEAPRVELVFAFFLRRMTIEGGTNMLIKHLALEPVAGADRMRQIDKFFALEYAVDGERLTLTSANGWLPKQSA